MPQRRTDAFQENRPIADTRVLFPATAAYRRFALAVLAALWIWACAAPEKKPAPADMSRIRVGMTEDSVVELLGEPALVDPYQAGKYIFYYPQTGKEDCIANKDECTPVVFSQGRVAAVGRLGEGKESGGQPPAPDSSEQRGPDEETRQEIERLNRQVRAIPAAKTLENLRIYRYLLKLDPGNPRYQAKVAHYEGQFKREQEQREQNRQIREERRKHNNELLSVFEGNDRIQMALEDQGNGRFYVRLKYFGSAPIALSRENFILVCEDGQSYGCYRCRDLEVQIRPGGRAEGKITFDAYCEAREMTFSHPEAGTFSRRFPQN